LFVEIKKALEQNKKVLFCGTPCQVSGLKKYIGEADGLYLVDLACHGVPSPMIWRDYVDYAIGRRGPLKYVNFRSKRLGYSVSVMEEINVNGKAYFASPRTHLMSKIFFRNIADRPSCYECKFKTISRCSDLTLFDSWHAAQLCSGLEDDNCGFTNVIVQSEKGRRLIEQYHSFFLGFECDTCKAVEADGKMILSSVQKPSARDLFFDYYSHNGLVNTVNHFLPIKRSDMVIEYIKILLNKLGLLRCLKRLKDK
jgi:hypothetical protein